MEKEHNILESKIWGEQGFKLTGQKRYSESIICYDKSIDLWNENYSAWINKGTVLTMQGKLEESIECFNKAITISPNEYPGWNCKGVSLRKLGNLEEYLKKYPSDIRKEKSIQILEESIECYDKALELSPKENKIINSVMWNGRGYALHAKKDYNKAIESYLKAIELNPKEISYFINLDDALNHRGIRK